MDTQLLEAIRTTIRDETRTIVRDEIRRELGSLEAQYCRMEERLDSIDENILRLEDRMGKVENRLDIVEAKVDELNADIKDVNRKLELRIRRTAENLEFKMNEGFEKAEIHHKHQDDQINSILEGWTIQKLHRRQLDDHEVRIDYIEGRIPIAS